MSEFLSDGWLARLAELGAHLPEIPGATGRVLHVVAGTPDGEVRYLVSYEDGRLVAVDAGDAGAEAEDVVSITTKYPDARALLAGDLDANALFMSGRSKVTGPTGPLLRYLSLTGTPGHESMRATLAADTEF